MNHPSDVTVSFTCGYAVGRENKFYGLDVNGTMIFPATIDCIPQSCFTPKTDYSSSVAKCQKYTGEAEPTKQFCANAQYDAACMNAMVTKNTCKSSCQSGYSPKPSVPAAGQPDKILICSPAAQFNQRGAITWKDGANADEAQWTLQNCKPNMCESGTITFGSLQR